MSTLPLISVIIPTYNRGNCVLRAVHSVLNQSFRNLELLVVDDGSTDSTSALLSHIEDSRFKVIKHEFNRGQNAALNTGISNSQGKYLAFLDSDDEWLPAFLDKLYSAASLLNYPACIYCEACFSGFSDTQAVKSFYLQGQEVYSLALRQGFVSHMITLLVPTSFARGIGGFDESFKVCQDDDFCIRLAKRYPFYLVKEQLAVIHCSSDSLIRNKHGYAAGWAKLISKYESEILRHCGSLILAYHKIRVAYFFVLADDVETGFQFAINFLPSFNVPSKRFIIKAYNKLFSWLYNHNFI